MICPFYYQNSLLWAWNPLFRPVHTIRFQGSDSLFRKLGEGVHTIRFQGSVFVVRMSEGHL